VKDFLTSEACKLEDTTIDVVKIAETETNHHAFFVTFQVLQNSHTCQSRTSQNIGARFTAGKPRMEKVYFLLGVLRKEFATTK